MRRIIEKIEGMEISVASWLAVFFSINLLRMTFESFSGNGLSIYPIKAIFLHPPLFYACVLLSTAILLRLITKVEMKKILNIVLFGFFAFIIPPVVDFIISGGKGDLQIRYLMAPLPELARDFITFLGPNFRSGATYGIRVEAFVTMLLVGMYIFIKTRNKGKTLLGVLIAYTIAFVYGALPGILGSLASLPANPWLTSPLDILRRFLATRDIFAISYGPEKIQELFSVEMALILLPMMFIQLLVAAYFLDPKKFVAFLQKFRYLRLLFQYGALFIGIVIGVTTFHKTFDHGAYAILTLVALFISATCVWAFSLTANDRNDVAIDAISNKDRLLVQGIFSIKEFEAIGLMSFVVAVVAAFAVGYSFLVLTLVSLVLAYLYSCPPMRLRRFAFIAPALMSLGTAILILEGFLPFAASGDFVEFPITFFVLMVFVVALVINIKDIKDIEGDKPNGISTIPTLFGEKRGKIIISLLFVLSFLLFPIILHSKQLIVTAVLFSVLSWLLINNKKVNEWLVFGSYSLFLIVVAFTVLRA